MKKILLLSCAALIVGVPLLLPNALAGQVDVTTYYDYPDGNFRELDVTGAVTLGTSNVGPPVLTFGLGGGSVSIGTTAGPPIALTVKGNAGGQVTSSFTKTDRFGVSMGGPAGGAAYGVLAGRGPGNAEAPLYLNAAQGGTVHIGGFGFAQNYQLQVSDANGVEGRIGLKQNGVNSGELQFDWASGGGQDGYYATYAP